MATNFTPAPWVTYKKRYYRFEGHDEVYDRWQGNVHIDAKEFARRGNPWELIEVVKATPVPKKETIKTGITTKKPTFKVGEGLSSEEKAYYEKKAGMTLKQVATKKDIQPPKKSFLASILLPETYEETKAKLALEPSKLKKLGIVGMAALSYLPLTPGKAGIKTGVKVAEKIGTKFLGKELINLERLNLPKTAKVVLQKTINEVKPELEAIRGGILKNEDIIEAAKSSDILRKVTTKEESLRMEAALLRTRQNLTELARDKNVTVELIDAIKVIKAAGTARARALNALKIEADPILGNIRVSLIKKLDNLGLTTEEIVKASEGIDFDNAAEVTKFYRQYVKPKLSEIIDEYRYINLLSSPKTQIVNTFSNLLQVSGLRPATRLASGMIDNIAVKLTGKEQEYYIKQVPAYYKGVYNSIGDAVKGFTDAMKGKTQIYRPDLSRIPTNVKLLRPFQYIPRLMEGSDVFFRTLATGGEMEALLKTGVKEASAIKKATDTAAELVFRKALDPKNKTGQGLVLSNIDKLTTVIYKFRNLPTVKWFIPFVQTPMNILKQGLEYSPAGISTLIGNTSKIEQLGKTMVGSTVFAGAAWLALQDRTTWSTPTSEKEKTAFYDAGMQPYSIKVGDKWIAYSRLGPLAYPIAMAAAIKYYAEDNPKSVTDSTMEKTGKAITGVAQFFTDQSYLEGLGDFIDVWRGDEAAISRVATNVPSQLVPLVSLQRWVANIVDPIYRKTTTGLSLESIKQNIMKSIPFLSKKLPTYETPTGQPSERQYPIPNAFSPASVTKEKPEGKELFNLMQQTSKETKLATQQKEQLNQQAEAEYNRLKTISEEQRKKELVNLVKTNPALAKQILSIAEDKQKNWTPTEKLIYSLGVDNGLRAKTIKAELNKLKTKEEKLAYCANLINKRILTKKVNEQLLKLLEN